MDNVPKVEYKVNEERAHTSIAREWFLKHRDDILLFLLIFLVIFALIGFFILRDVSPQKTPFKVHEL